METEGKIIRDAGFKRRFQNPDGSFEDLSYLDIENRVEERVMTELGLSVSDIFKAQLDFDLLERYYEIDRQVREGRPSESIYLIEGDIFAHRETLGLDHSCYGPTRSIVVFEGIQGDELGRRYQAQIEGSVITVQQEILI